jgi:hypothetical protein
VLQWGRDQLIAELAPRTVGKVNEQLTARKLTPVIAK